MKRSHIAVSALVLSALALVFAHGPPSADAATVLTPGAVPTGAAAGDLSGTYPSPAVAKVNGATVPAGGSLTTGNVLQASGAGALSYSPVNLAGGANYVSGALPNANQAAQTCTGDVTGNTGATVVSSINGTSPINVNPSAGSTTLSVDTTGALIGKTSSSNFGLRVAPLIGSETTYVGIWTGAQAVSPTSGNYAMAWPVYGGTIISQWGLAMPTYPLTVGAIGGNASGPMSWSTTATPIACSTGGTQTISAAQAGTPGLSVTSGTLSSNCTLDFGTNAVTGFYVLDMSGVTLNATFGVVFKNGATSRTYLSTGVISGTLATVWTHGTDSIAVNF